MKAEKNTICVSTSIPNRSIQTKTLTSIHVANAFRPLAILVSVQY